MGVKTSFDLLLRRAVDLFRKGGEFHPAELADALEKEAEKGKKKLVRGTYAPNIYRVRLSREDFADVRPLLEPLTAQLEQHLVETIRKKKHLLLAQGVRVDIGVDQGLKRNQATVDSRIERQPGFVEAAAESTAAAPAPPMEVAASVPPSQPQLFVEPAIEPSTAPAKSKVKPVPAPRRKPEPQVDPRKTILIDP